MAPRPPPNRIPFVPLMPQNEQCFRSTLLSIDTSRGQIQADYVVRRSWVRPRNSPGGLEFSELASRGLASRPEPPPRRYPHQWCGDCVGTTPTTVPRGDRG